MYYRLDANLNMNAGYLRDEDNLDETLMFGEKVDEAALVLPWPLTLVVRGSESPKLSDYYSGSNVMSIRLVELLRSCGVDNLQTFPAVITIDKTSEAITNYVVVNIIGLVAAASLNDSVTRPLADVQFFERMTIDTSKTHDLLMFRLEESRADVIVHEKVAKTIIDGEFVDVFLEPIDEVAGA